ncbi:uncharacterized protein PAC_14166 [Phialocephala subalpina]|uniref:AB hydrolase-1 domain-containing protein n=1 Tax=Phialocephala subalpina TaxID=576137 RepID=A0A1L7XGY7_9HELO|nr:uncharacterized protein PAC_14166 [Phialocephala subalpina]
MFAPQQHHRKQRETCKREWRERQNRRHYKLSLNMKTALIFILSACAGKNLIVDAQALPSNSLLVPPPATCTDVVIPVTASAENVVFPVTTPISYIKVGGTYNISARYCKPANNLHSRRNTLQFLVHGITFTKSYWSGLGDPSITQGAGAPYGGQNYSWISYASNEGYPTLAIDRLGNGLSDHPDPLTVLGTPLQTEIVHQLIVKARAGTLPSANGKAFNSVIYVGHSYGSFIGNYLNVQYPNDANATILTGVTSSENFPFVDAYLPDLVPAATANPVKWGNLPSGYLTLRNVSDYGKGFWYPPFFDSALEQLDFATRGPGAYSEFGSVVLPLEVAGKYTGPVFDITGQHDAIFCPLPDPASSTKPYTTYDCGPSQGGILSQTGKLYPNASYKYYAPKNSGHLWQLHYDAFATFG